MKILKNRLQKITFYVEQTCLAVKTFQKNKIREILAFQEIEKLPLFLLK
jgi:chemotaxis signal transduction protein